MITLLFNLLLTSLIGATHSFEDYRSALHNLHSWQDLQAEAEKGIDTGWSLKYSKQRVEYWNLKSTQILSQAGGEEFLRAFHSSPEFKKSRPESKSFVLPNRNTSPLFSTDALEVLGQADYPRDHITVSRDGKIFADVFDHDETTEVKITIFDPQTKSFVPFPSVKEQKEFTHIHSMRTDSKNRLWLLDTGKGLFATPRLFAYNIDTGDQVHKFEFPRSASGSGPYFNDFAIDERRQKLVITDTGPYPLFSAPALIIYDIQKKTARRVLVNHVSVRAGRANVYLDYENGKKWIYAGIVSPHVAVDGITFDPHRDYFYWAPNNSGHLYGMSADTLLDANSSQAQLREAVDYVAPITMTDGMAVDRNGNVILTDPEHSSILRLNPLTGELKTLVRDPQLLPFVSNLEFGPDGDMYFAAFPFHTYFGMKRDKILSFNKKYSLYRLTYE